MSLCLVYSSSNSLTFYSCLDIFLTFPCIVDNSMVTIPMESLGQSWHVKCLLEWPISKLWPEGILILIQLRREGIQVYIVKLKCNHLNQPVHALEFPYGVHCILNVGIVFAGCILIVGTAPTGCILSAGTPPMSNLLRCFYDVLLLQYFNAIIPNNIATTMHPGTSQTEQGRLFFLNRKLHIVTHSYTY